MGSPPRGNTTIRQLLSLLNTSDSPERVRILTCNALSNATSHVFGEQMLMTEMLALQSAVVKQFCSSADEALQVNKKLIITKSKSLPIFDLLQRQFNNIKKNFFGII